MEQSSYCNNSYLIKQLQKGDEGAFTYLINRFNKPLFIYALNLSRNRATAEDIVQNTFLKIWSYKEKLNPNLSIKNLLYKTTYNNFVTDYSKRHLFYPVENLYIEAVNETIKEENSENFAKKISIVTKAIEKLPKKCKKIFLLNKKEGLTNNEIAEYLKISPKTVEGQITKAYRRLRKLTEAEIALLFLLFSFYKKYLVDDKSRTNCIPYD